MATTSVRPPAAEVVGRQFVRDPDTWLLAVAALCAGLSGLQIFLYPMGRSLAEFAVSGRELLLGGAPAKTFWSLRAPGISIFYAFIEKVLGSSTLVFRAVEVACLLGLAFATTKLVKRITGLERVGAIGAALAICVHSQLEFEHTGQPELYAAVFLVLASWLTMREPTRHDRYYQFAGVGLLVGLATIFVPLFWLTLIPIGSFTFRAENERRPGLSPVFAVFALIGGSLIPILGVTIWLMLKGAWPLFLSDWVKPQLLLFTSWSFEGFLEWIYYVTDRLFLRQSAIIPAGCLVAYTLPRMHHYESKGLKLLLGIVLVMVFAFAISGESNPGRLSGAIPFLSMIAGIGIYKLYRRLLGLGAFPLTAFWSGLVLLAALNTAVGVAPGSYFFRSFTRIKFLVGVMPYRAFELLEGELYNNAKINLTGARRVLSTIERQGSPGVILVQGDEPELLWMLKRRPPTRLIRPLPDDMAVACPELDVKLSEAIAALSPKLYVISPWTAAMPLGTLATRLGPSRDQVAAQSELVAVTEGWGIWGPKKIETVTK
jgi:MFS family permease